MAQGHNNLLLRLHKWAWRQDENFLTEAFAHVLQQLVDNEPEAAARLLKAITLGFLDVRTEKVRLVEIRTQVFSSEGTPDLEIRTTQELIYFEVKSESEIRPTQLERYRRLLKESGLGRTALFMLTRYPLDLQGVISGPDASIRWYQVAEWLEEERRRYTFKAVSEYVVAQFLDFLTTRNMTMGQVTWELAGGLRALRALSDMLFEVAKACGCHAQLYGDKSSMGIHLDKRKYWIGVYYDQPESLWFETNYCKVDPVAAERLGVEGVYEWTQEPGHGWRKGMNLESEDVHFFSRSKASQMQLLEIFLKECLETVRRIELPNQPTRLDGEEGKT